MFKVGQEYLTNGGLKVRIVSNDAAFKVTVTSPLCNVVGILTHANGNQVLHWFDDAGNYAGVTNNATYKVHNIVSDEPNEEEVALISTIQSMCEKEGATKENLLKVIRQLRTK